MTWENVFRGVAMVLCFWIGVGVERYRVRKVIAEIKRDVEKGWRP